MRLSFVSALLAAALLPVPAYAYVGPGLGAGVIGAILAVVGAVALSLFAIIYYPIKRVMRKRRAEKASTDDKAGPAE